MRSILAAMLLLFSMPVFAVNLPPENGWWWNPNEPGYGYNIEVQNGLIFVATFTYTESGAPIWYSGAGRLQDGKLSIDLLRHTGGPCFTCAYNAPTDSQSGHHLIITFHSPDHATVTVDGVSYPIQRFNYGYGFGIHKLLGCWSVSVLNTPFIGSLGVSDLICYGSVSNGKAIGARFPSPSLSVLAKQAKKKKFFVSASELQNGKVFLAAFQFNGLNHIAGVAAIVERQDSTASMLRQLMQKDQRVILYGSRFFLPSDKAIQTAAVRSNGHKESTLARKVEALTEIIEARHVPLPALIRSQIQRHF